MVTMSVDERRESCASVDSISSTGSNTCHAPKFGTRIKNRVFIGGLPPQTSDKELSAFFSDYGTIKDCKIINDRAGISRGYGFLTFDSEEVASNVVADASKEPKIFKERRLNIAPAVRKNEPFRPAPPPFHFSPGGYPPPPPGGSPYPHPHHHPHPSLSYPYPSPFGYPAPSPPAYYPHPPNGSIPEFHYYNPSPQAMPHPPGAGTPNTASSVASDDCSHVNTSDLGSMYPPPLVSPPNGLPGPQVPCSSHVFYGPSTGPIYVHPSPYALGGWPPGPGSYRPWTPSSGSQGDQSHDGASTTSSSSVPPSFPPAHSMGLPPPSLTTPSGPGGSYDLYYYPPYAPGFHPPYPSPHLDSSQSAASTTGWSDASSAESPPPPPFPRHYHFKSPSNDSGTKTASEPDDQICPQYSESLLAHDSSASSICATNSSSTLSVPGSSNSSAKDPNNNPPSPVFPKRAPVVCVSALLDRRTPSPEPPPPPKRTHTPPDSNSSPTQSTLSSYASLLPPPVSSAAPLFPPPASHSRPNLPVYPPAPRSLPRILASSTSSRRHSPANAAGPSVSPSSFPPLPFPSPAPSRYTRVFTSNTYNANKQATSSSSVAVCPSSSPLLSSIVASTSSRALSLNAKSPLGTNAAAVTGQMADLNLNGGDSHEGRR